MKTARIILLVVSSIAIIVYVGASWFFSSAIIDIPSLSLAENSESVPNDLFQSVGLADPQDVSIENLEITMFGWYFDNPSISQCAVLFLHGIGGTRYAGVRYAPIFWNQGCDLLLVDLRSNGDSTGQFDTYGYYEKQDIVKAIDWLESRTNLPPSHIGLMGVSYGAAIALQVAPLEPELGFIIADSSFQSLSSIVTEQGVNQFGNALRLFIPGALVISALRANFNPWQVSPITSIENTSVPILLIHSLQDNYMSPENSRAIYEHLPHNHSSLLITDWKADHADSFGANMDEYTTNVQEFLGQYAQGFNEPVP